MKNIRIFTVSALFAATVAHAEAPSAPIKIGYLEMNKAIGSSKGGQAIQQKVMAKQGELQQELSVKAQSFMSKQRALEQKVKEGLIDQTSLREQQLALESEAQILKAEEARTGQRFEIWHQEVQQTQILPFMEEMQKCVECIAKAEKYSVVVARETGAVIYADPSLDITAKVITDLDVAHSKKTAKKEAAKPAAPAKTEHKNAPVAVVKNDKVVAIER